MNTLHLTIREYESHDAASVNAVALEAFEQFKENRKLPRSVDIRR